MTKMSKIQEVFKKKYLISTFTATGHRVAFGHFKDGYEAKMAETCEWTPRDDGGETFDTECGLNYYFLGSSLSNGHVKYCPFCGGKIVEKEAAAKEMWEYFDEEAEG